MFGRVHKFAALDWQRKKLLVQAWLLLGYLKLLLRRKPFKKLVAGLEMHREPGVQSPLDPESQEMARAVGWAVRVAANQTPWVSTCLVQVLTAQKMLENRGVAGVFYVGASSVREKTPPKFQAHAWLTCNGEVITGEQGHQNYTVVSAFSWR